MELILLLTALALAIAGTIAAAIGTTGFYEEISKSFDDKMYSIEAIMVIAAAMSLFASIALGFLEPR